jgi:hypothetical protein
MLRAIILSVRIRERGWRKEDASVFRGFAMRRLRQSEGRRDSYFRKVVVRRYGDRLVDVAASTKVSRRVIDFNIFKR